MGMRMFSRCTCLIGACLLAFLPSIPHAETPDQQSYPISAWPLFYQEENKDKGETDVLWPLSHHEWDGTREKYALRPFLFSTESDTSKDYRKTSVLWPLNTYEREGGKLDMHLMLYWHGREAPSTYTTLFPVYWTREGKEPTYFHIWPLYGEYRKGGYAEHSTLFPFFRYGTDPQKEELDIHLFWPLMNYHRYPGYLSHRLLPFYEYEKGAEVSGGYVFPYYWRDAVDQHARGIFPIWYSSRGPDRKTDVVFPLYLNRETPDNRLQLILPLYGSWRDRESSLQTILPAYLDYRRPDFSLRLGFPLYWEYRDDSFSFSTIFPVYYHSRNVAVPSELTYYFPVYGTYRIGEAYSRHFLFMPLYSSYYDEGLQTGGWDILWPLFHYQTGPERFSARALPFLWVDRSPGASLTAGFPLYLSYQTAGRSYLHVVPFYGKHTRGGTYQETYLLGPLYIDTRDESAGLERKDILFPFFSMIRQNDTLRSWLFPLYFHREDKDSHLTFASPCLLPPYYYTYHDSTSRGFNLWPLYHSSLNNGYREHGILWPLLRYGHDEAGTNSFTQVILFYGEKDKDKTFSTLFPLWWHRSSPERTSDSSLIVHSYERDPRTDDTRFALIWLMDEDLGVFTYKRTGAEALAARFLYRVVSYERSGGNSEFRFLWRLVRTYSAPDTEIFELNPLYYRRTDKDKASYWAIFGGLIGCMTSAEGKRTPRYLWVF